jgi:hypothetical protein
VQRGLVKVVGGGGVDLCVVHAPIMTRGIGNVKGYWQ